MIVPEVVTMTGHTAEGRTHQHGDGHGQGHGHGPAEGDDMPEVLDAAYWNERYRSRDALWSGRPNPNLVAEAAGLAPGRALDVGCGEGADALWLAERGWEVTAVDISAVALARARAHAGKTASGAGQRVTWLERDLTTWDPPATRYALVSAQYVHVPSGQRAISFGKLALSVAPGGTLLIVGHHPSDLDTTAARPRRPDLFFTGDDVAGLLSPGEWRIVVNEARGRDTTDPEGRAITIHDSVLRAERLV
jgi:SAM-dependent methyltransferase